MVSSPVLRGNEIQVVSGNGGVYYVPIPEEFQEYKEDIQVIVEAMSTALDEPLSFLEVRQGILIVHFPRKEFAIVYLLDAPTPTASA